MKTTVNPKVNSAVAGFTLVELMVVVAIIGILAAVAGPRVQSFRAKGVQTEAKSNLHSLYLAMIAFEDANDQFPAIVGACAESATTGCGPAEERITFIARPDNKYNYGINSVPASSRWTAGASTKRPLLRGQRDKWAINTNKALCSQTDVTNETSVTNPNAGNAPNGGCVAVRGEALPVDDNGTVAAPVARDDKQ
jgi:prepilin-type N-terminal cleavage/methylation domain-containing protein